MFTPQDREYGPLNGGVGPKMIQTAAEVGDGLITDEILNEFAVVGELHEIADKTKQRVGDFVDRITCMVPVKNSSATRKVHAAFAD